MADSQVGEAALTLKAFNSSYSISDTLSIQCQGIWCMYGAWFTAPWGVCGGGGGGRGVVVGCCVPCLPRCLHV